MHYVQIKETRYYISLPCMGPIPPGIFTYGVVTNISPPSYLADLYLGDLKERRFENGPERYVHYDLEYSREITDEEAEELERKTKEYEELKANLRQEKVDRENRLTKELLENKAKKKYNRWWRRLWRAMVTGDKS